MGIDTHMRDEINTTGEYGGSSSGAATSDGSLVRRHFTTDGDTLDSVLLAVAYEKRVTVLKNRDGKIVWSNEKEGGFRVPRFWSQLAGDIVAEKYSRKRGVNLPNGRESGVDDVVRRIVRGISERGWKLGYFRSHVDKTAFEAELAFLQIHQYGAFNSPVWFNVGLHLIGAEGGENNYKWHPHNQTWEPTVKSDCYKYPQASACFILRREDTLKDIFKGVGDESQLFKGGSGAGSNFSRIRGENEPLSGGGKSSGLLKFLKVYDSGAGATKSGGTTRRAAKMVCLDVGHPDILKFIQWKAKEEKKARILLDAGIGLDANGNPDFNGEAYETVGGQNANNSVRVTDDFMRRAAGYEPDPFYTTHYRTSGEVCESLKAPYVLDEMAKAAWACGCPGIQYDTTINRMNTCAGTDKIYASNPCCFVGETLVDTSEGRVSIEALAEMSLRGEALPLAFAFDLDSSLPVLRPILRAWVAGHTDRLVEVRTQRGLTLRCTPEHRFLLHNGSYVEARHLSPNDRLRKINRTQNEDRLSNLELLPMENHRSDHSAGENNPRYLGVSLDRLVEIYEAVAAVNRGRPSKVGTVSISRWNRYIEENGLKGEIPLANTRGIRGDSWENFLSTIQGRQAEMNDRILSVREVRLDSPVAVYDLEVEGTHNFSVTNPGAEDLLHTIVVHNSEFMFLDDTACNLASLNLTKFLPEGAAFNFASYAAAIQVFIVAQDILVSMSSYPTKEIAKNSEEFRPLGLGYANLGSLLLHYGYGYGTPEAQYLTACVTAYLTGMSYLTSQALAERLGPFAGYETNKDPMGVVIGEHAKAALSLTIPDGCENHEGAAKAAHNVWKQVLQNSGGSSFNGYRNSQVTVLAPTGTIGLAMDCETTGIEPFLAFKMWKLFAGGQYREIVLEDSIKTGLKALGISDHYIGGMVRYFQKYGHFNKYEERVQRLFLTSLPNKAGKSLHWRDHLSMMAAAQPFLSGAISKTVNMPENTTWEEIRQAYIEGWTLGLKAVAVYRDGCKASQPLSTSNKSKKKDEKAQEAIPAIGEAQEKAVKSFVMTTMTHTRVKMGHTAINRTDRFKLRIGGQEVYLHVGKAEDGRPLEIFLRGLKTGGDLIALLDSWCISTSIAMQYGAPLEDLVEKFTFVRFAPHGPVQNHARIKFATSIIDLVFRVIAVEYLGRMDLGHVDPEEEAGTTVTIHPSPTPTPQKSLTGDSSDAPFCDNCGHKTFRNGACYKCLNCGNSLGCS